ncbi:hypothetical protein GGQ88_003838 [Novosphingobium hassiacum]|uniref:Transcriptional regulator-like domain-containing protein n=1 Tax=Novosphingobium hassiacum TaxID=173676 RepID=A0A7W6A1W1_9SPHN|nr:DUF6499 domain-containing protein [Novosphingobium hassiacum]MBB3862537.1 hypothetical protein [Novosphingobium hassiacum]
MSQEDNGPASDDKAVPDELTLAEFAAEFLRRNPDYQQDFQSLAEQEARPDVAAALARRWGLRFRPGPGATHSAGPADLAN